MATLLFYQNPVQLNTDRHRLAKLGNVNGDFGFSRETNSIPLAAVEFFEVAREYPIVFSGPEKGPLLPIAMVGIRQNENLYVGAGGQWEGRYVPAFVRRYPFVLAEGEADDFSVFLDESYPGFGAPEGERLFTDSSEYAPILKQALEFLRTYQVETKRTRLFVERLLALNLLVPRVLEFARPGDQPLVLKGFSVVDEARVNELDDRELLELARRGFLTWVHAHLMSLSNLPVLGDRLTALIAAGVKGAAASSAAAVPAAPAVDRAKVPKKKR